MLQGLRLPSQGRTVGNIPSKECPTKAEDWLPLPSALVPRRSLPRIHWVDILRWYRAARAHLRAAARRWTMQACLVHQSTTFGPARNISQKLWPSMVRMKHRSALMLTRLCRHAGAITSRRIDTSWEARHVKWGLEELHIKELKEPSRDRTRTRPPAQGR
jgi:hypothetical protein